MIIQYDPDEWVSESEYKRLPCPYCDGSMTCNHAYGTSSYTQRRATATEREANKLRRLKKEEIQLKDRLHKVLTEISLMENKDIWKRLAAR